MVAGLETWHIVAFGVVAFLYAMVGHGGASGYLAILALSPLGKEEIAILALVMNLFVAGSSFAMFGWGKHMDWKLTWPFLLGSIPFAVLGAVFSLQLSAAAYFYLVAGSLLLGAVRLLWPATNYGEHAQPSAKWPYRVAIGSGVGLVSGLIGVGGGIFLSPILLLTRWATSKSASASAAVFILVNSMAGLTVRLNGRHALPEGWGYLALVGVVGAVMGASLGSFRLANATLRQALGAVLLFAAFKLAFK